MNQDYLKMMKELLKDNYDSYVNSLNEPPKRGVRLYVSNHNLDVKKIPFGKNEYELLSSDKIGNSVLHHLGGIYLQEPSAMAPVNLVDIKEDAICLDMCASPGGKSCQILDRIPKGILVSNEIDKKRSQILFSNIERLGYNNAIVLNEDPINLVDNFSNTFDLILLDAPCSGEGMFRKSVDAVDMWNNGNVATSSIRDKRLMEAADKMLKCGGIIIYSTCTFSIEEDESIISDFIKTHDYSVITPNNDVLKCGEKGLIDGAVRYYPHTSIGEGQFMCAIKKNSSTEQSIFKNKLPKPESKEIKLINEFINEATHDLKLNLVKRGSEIFHLATNDINLNGLNVVSYGVRLGEVTNRFIPNHNFFKAFPKSFNNVVRLDYDDINAIKYIRGEELEIDSKKGYGVIMIEDKALGGFKASNGVLKNLYPKGLRNV